MSRHDRPRRWVTAALTAVALAVATTACSPAGATADATPADTAPAAEGTAVAVDTRQPSAVSPTRTADEPASPPTLQALLAQDRFVPLAVALDRSELDQVIEDLDHFLLLAPTSDAFETVGTDIGIEYSTLMNDPRLLEAVMRFHIIADPTGDTSWRTMNGSSVEVERSDLETVASVNGVEVLDQIAVRNGTVVVMPRVLLPSVSGSVSSTDPSQ